MKVIPEKIIESCMPCHWLVVPDRNCPDKRACFGGNASREMDVDYYTTIPLWCPLPEYKPERVKDLCPECDTPTDMVILRQQIVQEIKEELEKQERGNIDPDSVDVLDYTRDIP